MFLKFGPCVIPAEKIDKIDLGFDEEGRVKIFMTFNETVTVEPELSEKIRAYFSEKQENVTVIA